MIMVELREEYEWRRVNRKLILIYALMCFVVCWCFDVGRYCQICHKEKRKRK